MYIVYLSHNPFVVSGGVRVVNEHTNRLAGKGHRVELWHTVDEATSPFKNTVSARKLNISKLNDPDTVVMCDPAFLRLVTANRQKDGLFLLLQHDIERITEDEVRNTYTDLMRRVSQLVKSNRCTILVVSDWLHMAVKDRYNLNSIVIENGVDDRLFSKTKPYIKTVNPTVLFVYDPQPWKRANYAFNILLEVHRKIPNLEVFILSTVILSTPQEQALSYSFPFPVTIYCNQPQDRLASIYSSADIFLSTSKYEGFCLPVLEAFSCGVSVVTTDSGGNQTFAINNKTSLIIPPQ